MMSPHGTIAWTQDPDGIVTLTLDDLGNQVNLINPACAQSMHRAVEQLRTAGEALTGVVVTSAEPPFFAGGDIDMLYRISEDTLLTAKALIEQIKADLRSIETLGKPVVAALNGSALGGGLEIALACHWRIALSDGKAQFGFPEVTMGLLPGCGGVTRVTRLLGISDGLTKVLLPGKRLSAAQARAIGLVDEVVSTPEELIKLAKARIKSHPQSVQRWDEPGYELPGGAPRTPSGQAITLALPPYLRKAFKGAPIPAQHHIVCAAVEGAAVDIDSAFKIEERYFLDLASGQVAKNMMKAFWFDLNSVRAGASRPAGYERRPARKIAVVGAGLMGAGIAYVSARNGLDVVLKDVSVDVASRGKEQSRQRLDKEVSLGELSEEERDTILDRIVVTDDYAHIADCDLVVEAVFENPSLKIEVFREIERKVPADALLASNTSTLPITDLAAATGRAEGFIGLHFFSPVDKMALLEIVRGEHTSDATLVRALDFAAQINKIPIVVRDNRGFFTTRVVMTFTNEALAMLAEGVPPATIEQAALQAGYPVGALQLCDELNIELLVQIRDAARDAAGTDYVRHPAEDALEKMIQNGRAGRSRGAGFFAYDEQGKRTGLWPGLAELFAPKDRPQDVDLAELGERMLVIEAVESARCMEEGVLGAVADANIGSIMGIGYPTWTGGVLQYINGFDRGRGVAAFVAHASDFAARFGKRFEPNVMLRKMAENRECF
jgi:3-hydroxyacyl-CoA dehydrogenase/enoyl-CoA hydratase/3-hydroxybutyryl-CoA epimerase